MRLTVGIATLAVLVLAGACKGSAGGGGEGAATAAVTPASPEAGGPAGEPKPMKVIEKVSSLSVGSTVHVCWRAVPAGNPLLAEGPFDCGTTVKAVPFPGGGGDLHGDLLFPAFEGKTKGALREVRLRSEEPGREPGGGSTSMLNIGKGTNEFYGAYVVKTDDGALRVFLDVEVTDK